MTTCGGCWSIFSIICLIWVKYCGVALMSTVFDTGSATITKAQHCRAEIWLEGHGWVATDPADVRKVVLEEPPGSNAVDNPKVVAAREALFGAWEGNWLGYNMAHDLALPGSRHKVGFLMYPQAEVAGALLDCLDPDTFRYTIKSTEITA